LQLILQLLYTWFTPQAGEISARDAMIQKYLEIINSQVARFTPIFYTWFTPIFSLPYT
jgi:hypothetical protein